MSIVYDYLKQIQDKKETKKVAVEASSFNRRSGSSLGMKIAVAVFGCLLLGTGLYFFLPKLGDTAIRIPQAPQKTPAVPQTSPDFAFLLEGIIYNPSRPFAIIDGKMLEVGAQVGDFEVVKITPDTVSLKSLKDGTFRTVRL